jgi:hypothetical protein
MLNVYNFRKQSVYKVAKIFLAVFGIEGKLHALVRSVLLLVFILYQLNAFNVRSTCFLKNSLLGVFAKLRQATMSFFLYVHPSVRLEQLFSHWMDFHQI